MRRFSCVPPINKNLQSTTFPTSALAESCSIPVVPASVRASVPSTSLSRVSGDKALSLKSHTEVQQAWSARCRRVANQHPGYQASSDVALTTSSCPSAFRQRGDKSCPAMHADLLLDSWKAYTLTQIAGKPVSTRQAETAPVQRAGGGRVTNKSKSREQALYRHRCIRASFARW